MDLMWIKVVACPKCSTPKITSEHQSSRGETRVFLCGYMLQVVLPKPDVIEAQACRFQPVIQPKVSLRDTSIVNVRVAAIQELMQYLALMKCDDTLRNYLNSELRKAIKAVGG